MLAKLTAEQNKLPIVVLGYGEPYFVRVDEEHVYILCSSLVQGWLLATKTNPAAARAEMRSFFGRTSLVY